MASERMNPAANQPFNSAIRCVDESEPYHAAYTDFRCRGLAAIGSALARRLRTGDEGKVSAFSQAFAQFINLPSEAKHQLVQLPFYSYWWNRLSLLYSAGDRQALSDWVGHFPEFIAPHGITGPLGMQEIILDHVEPWLNDYLHTANGNTRDQGGRGDVKQTTLAGQRLSALHDSVEMLRELWPEMHKEVSALVRLIVPFESEEIASFSNSSLGGIIFLRTDTENPIATAERIVHETSHVRLSEIMTLAQIHTHRPEDTLPSPYRKSVRPVDGLCHGVFVFCRIAMFHLNAHRQTGSKAHRARLNEVLSMQQSALQVIADGVQLTPFGVEFINELKGKTCDLMSSADEL
jgi:HEXXH motif-containing protein